MILPDHAVHLGPHAHHNVAQHPVVHIHAALPHHLPGVDPQFVALLDMVVQQGCQQIIGAGNGVKIPGEMKVQILHGHHLGISSPGRPSLNAETRPQRRLPQSDNRFFAQLPEGFSQAHGDRGLALPGRGGIDGRHQDQFALRPVLKPPDIPVGNLGLIFTVQFQLLLGDSRALRHQCDRLQHRFLRNLNVCFHGPPPFYPA